MYKMQSRKCARKSDSKRVKKTMQRELQDGGVAANGQSSSCCTFENDSNAFRGPPVAANLNCKVQADRRSATESQSLYAKVLLMIF